MKPNLLYAQLELLPEAADRHRPLEALGARSKVAVRAIAQRLVAYLCGSTDPRVQIEGDRHGQLCYKVYDPTTQQRHTFATEADLREWLDRRYYL